VETLRSLALKGCRFETWQEIVETAEAATAYWNEHKHPFVWSKRRRHPASRHSALLCFQKWREVSEWTISSYPHTVLPSPTTLTF
jgi:hypothetical protein